MKSRLAKKLRKYPWRYPPGKVMKAIREFGWWAKGEPNLRKMMVSFLKYIKRKGTSVEDSFKEKRNAGPQE